MIMYIIGEQSILNKDHGVEPFYMSVYPRLLSEVEGVDTISRLVGFRAYTSGGEFTQFFGIEVNSIGAIPDGMVGWSLDDDSFTVTDADDHKNSVLLRWVWKDETTGEFCSRLPGASNNVELSWQMTTNCYITKCRDDADPDIVELVDYDQAWGAEFHNMEQKLKNKFASVITRIEHYGSTAISGMPAKPVIDILVEVPSFDIARREFIPRLSGEACEYWWYTDHIIFIVREKPFGRRSHHIHIAPKGHRLWEGIAFRDYLIANPDTAAQYAALKRRLSVEHRNDREKYTGAKTDFVRRITDKALLESFIK